MTDVEQALGRLRAEHWKWNKRSVVMNKEFKAAKERHELGKFKETLEELQADQHNGEQVGHRNLNAIAVTLLGLGQHEQALEALDEAERRLIDQAVDNVRERAMLRVNRAMVLKSLDDYEGAHAAAREALEFDPSWVVPHLLALALYSSDCDLDGAYRAFETMDQDCPGWDQDPEAWWYLMEDFDYAPIRQSIRFDRWLGRKRPKTEEER